MAIIPGTPKNPAISDVIGLMGNEKLKFNPIILRLAPIIFTIYNDINPIIPFNIIFIGHFSNFIIINSSIIPTKPYIKYCSLILQLLPSAFLF